MIFLEYAGRCIAVFMLAFANSFLTRTPSLVFLDESIFNYLFSHHAIVCGKQESIHHLLTAGKEGHCTWSNKIGSLPHSAFVCTACDCRLHISSASGSSRHSAVEQVKYADDLHEDEP